MKETYVLSDNLYYADQLGSVEEQIKFLDSFHFKDPVLVTSYPSMHEYLEFVATEVFDSRIYSRFCILYPGLNRNIRTFKCSKVVDIRRYLIDRGFSINSTNVFYQYHQKNSKLCVEDVIEAVADTAAAEDAASACPTEVSECGN